ncbi:MAG: serine hydrolase [Planctomycetes bacterium]|nr:serine hydrolase [Planctomycetota bacterium]
MRLTFACLLVTSCVCAQPQLDALLAPVHPDVAKWATVVRVQDPVGVPEFTWYELAKSRDAVDFWPASTIKLYAAIAAIEFLNGEGLPLDVTVSYARRLTSDRWVLDCARTVPEMISEVFRRSSNEDYTLLLRMLGIDRINTQFLIPAKGFPHSALMRDYVTYRPVVYENEEPQRITITTPEGKARVFEHTWSGISYAERRGATVLSSTTGNCTSTHELADCLRRVLFHDVLPEAERFALTSAQAKLLVEGDEERGLVGLRNREAGAYGWETSGELVFPNARYYHKAGLISTYALDVCYLADEASGTYLILALASRSGDPQVVRDMAKRIYEAARDDEL